MARSSQAPALFEARATQMNLGLDLNTDHNLKWGQIGATSRSLRYERGSGVYTGPGYFLSATPVPSVAYNGSLEATKIKDTVWVALGTKIQYSHDAVTFYDTGLTRTAAISQGFLEGPDGDIYTSNQTDGGVRIAVGILKADVALNGDIDVGTVNYSKFTASGTVIVNGVAVTYSGHDGTSKLTGTNIAATSAGALVIQTSAKSGMPKGYILISVESKLLVMGVKDLEHIVYYSRTASLANPEYFYDFSGSGSGSQVVPGAVRAAITGVLGGYMFLSRGIQKINGFDTTTGALTLQEVSHDYGVYNEKCVVDMDGEIAFLGQKRLIPITLTLAPTGQTAPFLGDTFDKPIRPWLDSHDDTNNQQSAYLKWDKSQKILKIGGVVGGALQTYVFDKQNPGFLPRENRQVGTSCMFLGRSFFGHTDDGGWYEDDLSRTNNQIPISHIISTGDIELDNGLKYLDCKEFLYKGLMTQSSTHILRVYVNGSNDAAFEIEYSSDDLIVSQSGRPLGQRGSTDLIGGSPGETILVYPYVNRVLLIGLEGEYFRFEWEITGDGFFFLLYDWYFSASIRRKQPRTAF